MSAPPALPVTISPEQAPEGKVVRAILDFVKAMRTAPSSTPDEAVAWATIEMEFTTRLNEIDAK